MPQLRSLPAWAPLAALVTASALVRFLVALGVAVPWISPDEVVYAELGRNLYETGTLGVLGEPTAFYSFVYPALVGIPLLLDDVGLAYGLLKALQAVVLSLTAVPVYLWGRELMSRGWALLAAALTLAVPGLAYAGLVMTEVAFYPVMAFASWAAARALVEPTPARQALLLGAIMVACATRLQGAVLVPILLTALGLQAAFERSGWTVRRFGPTLLGLLVLSAAWAAWQLRDGGSWSQLFAAYQLAGETSYSVGRSLEFAAYHAGGVAIMTAVVPGCALALLALEAARGREATREVRAFLAVTVSLVVWLVVEVGIFASEHVGRLAERDLLAVLPPLFLGFALWLDRGAPRPRVATTLVALAAAALVLTVPLDDFAVEEGIHDAFSLIPLYRLGDDAELAFYVAASLAVVLFVAVPRRGLAVLPALVGAWLVTCSVVASDEIVERSRTQQRLLLGDEPRWVDRAVGSGVAYLYDGEPYWNAVWEHVFWNRSIEHVLDLPGALVPGPLPQQPVAVREGGRIVLRDGRPIPVRHLVASTALAFAGERLAETRQEGTSQAGLVLWRLTGPARLSSEATGLQANGDIVTSAALRAWRCAGGAFTVAVFNKAATRIAIRRAGVTVREAPLGPGEAWSARIPAPPDSGGECTFEVAVDGLVGTTAFEFVRPGTRVQ